ncbi:MULTISPECIES: hypothetical protein [unclassified Paenibacillus]|uniref:hypothetical protein n=1 Tax=unclassified Paenibacillus TaxID=185978 RepID=UPI0008BE4883|nr:MULTISPECIES: hypothetical protein [unclassified Paenibacillus]QLG41259.1 hypothetical protein HW560_26245 [Paenibacillus sp. E222]SEN32650.1 hypothetical protein SAMN05518670_1586 [Paenibacillus sp. OK076]
MISVIISILMYQSPTIVFTKEEIEEYEELSKSVNEGRLIDYSLQYPKHRFLHYLSLNGKYVFHGSNDGNIERFEPRKQTLYNNELTTAVFATTEPLWSIFYSVFNRSALIGSFRNGCIIGRNKKYHYYSINESTINNNPWTDGMLYILPRDKFHMSGHGKVQFDEWICNEFVTPIAKISVSLSDFFFLNKVAVHKDKESLTSTWIFYKARTLLANSKRASNST